MPMQRHRYPPDWETISRRIRARDGQRCRFCGVPNHMRGWRDDRGCFHPLTSWEAPPIGRRLTIIVLTVAHIGENKHDKMDVSALMSLCQACHLWIDIDEHKENARATRTRKRSEAAAKRGQQQLFEEKEITSDATNETE